MAEVEGRVENSFGGVSGEDDGRERGSGGRKYGENVHLLDAFVLLLLGLEALAGGDGCLEV